MTAEILEIVALLEEFPEGLLIGKTNKHTIVWFKKNSDQYEVIGGLIKKRSKLIY